MEYREGQLWIARHAEWLVLFVLTAAVLSIYVPYNLRDPLLFVGLLAVYRERHLIRVDAGLKHVVLLVLAYAVIFTVISTDPARSAKGAYDMARGMLVFFVGYLLASKLQDSSRFIAFTAMVVVVILLAFLLPQKTGHGETFYGYHLNPNNTAVSLAVYVILCIPMVGNGRRKAGWLLSGVGIAVGAYLLLLANSRGAWLGMFGACMVILFVQMHVRRVQRLAISGVVAAVFLVVFLFANVKGASLSLRDQIWLGLLNETLHSSPWLGFGLNCVKDVMVSLGLPTLTAHNLFLEIFVSSGVVGLAFMLFVMVVLVRHLLSFEYRRTAPFYMGIGGLVAYFLMAQFDLKMSSFRFMATMSLFLGLLYSQRLPRERS